MSLTCDPIRLGVIGLGRAFVLMLATFRADDRIKPVAASDPRVEARNAFEAEFGGRSYGSLTDFFADPRIEAIYIASPHQFHCEHAIKAAQAGKHVLVEKPMAVTVDEALHMVDVFKSAGLHLIVGPCHSFDAPVLKAREIISSGKIGEVRMLHALNCTDFLYRPRRPEELRSKAGGGVVFSQGVHQIDVVRLLCGQKAARVTAFTGAWDPARATEGAYSALLAFENGVFASLTYSGYGHFNSDLWQEGIGEQGHASQQQDYGRARRALANAGSAQDEADLKAMRTYGLAAAGSVGPLPPEFHEHFGPLLVFGDRADLRITAKGVHIYNDTEQEFAPCRMRHVRADVIDGLWAALRRGQPPPQTGSWGLASLEICHAILKSSQDGKTINLQHQIGLTS